MPNPFDPNSYGMPSFEDLMVGSLTESAARAKMEADQRAVAEQLRRQQRRVQPGDMMQREAPGGMTVHSNDNGTYVANMLDLASRAERGQPIPPHIMRGMTVPDAVGQLGYGLGSRGLNRELGAEPSMPTMPLPTPEYRSEPYKAGDDPERVRMDKARKLDDFALESGGLPAEMFSGKSEAEAIGMLADQLRARRARLGDGGAWLTAGTADI